MRKAGLPRLRGSELYRKAVVHKACFIVLNVMLALKKDLFTKTTICSGMKKIYGIYDSIPAV